MKKILIVDDSATSKLLFKAYMPEGSQYEIHDANNLKTALEAAKTVKPDIVFMDYNMPEKNGVEIAKAMLHEGLSAKFVLLTANTQASVLKAAQDAGFVTVLEKPITREKIVATLVKVS